MAPPLELATTTLAHLRRAQRDRMRARARGETRRPPAAGPGRPLEGGARRAARRPPPLPF